MTRTDNFDTVIEDKKSYGCADEIIAMHEGIDQQFFEYQNGNLRSARCVHTTSRLTLVEIVLDESHGTVEYTSSRTSSDTAAPSLKLRDRLMYGLFNRGVPHRVHVQQPPHL